MHSAGISGYSSSLNDCIGVAYDNSCYPCGRIGFEDFGPCRGRSIPKQFHALVSAEPLLADAARRVPSTPPYTPPFVITNEQNRFGVAAAFKHADLPLAGIVLEPKAGPPRLPPPLPRIWRSRAQGRMRRCC